MTAPPSRRSGPWALLDAPIEVVDRQPERPRGPLPLDPETAGWVVRAAFAALLLTAVLIMLLIWERGGSPESITRLLGMSVAAAGGVVSVAATQRVAAVTGQRTLASRLMVVGLVAAAGWGIFAGLDWRGFTRLPFIIAGGAGTATIAWVVGTVGVVQLGQATTSAGLRRFRRIAAGLLLFAALSLVAGIWMGLVLMLADAVPRGATSLALGVLLTIGGWGTLLGLGLCFSSSSMARRMERKRSKRSETVDTGATIRVHCPGCSEPADWPRGLHRCSTCGTRVRVWIEEPRCRCGYALFRLTGDRCPECGQTVPEADRYNVRRFATDEECDRSSDVASPDG